MFLDSSDGIEEFTTSVTGFINKCIDDVVPTVTMHTYCTYLNQKPWITGNIHTELQARAATFKQDTNPDAYRKPCCVLQRTIKQVKLQYRNKIESYYTSCDAHRMLQCLQTITDYKGKPSRELPSNARLPNKLNTFYARFKASNTKPCMMITFSVADVNKTFTLLLQWDKSGSHRVLLGSLEQIFLETNIYTSDTWLWACRDEMYSILSLYLNIRLDYTSQKTEK